MEKTEYEPYIKKILIKSLEGVEKFCAVLPAIACLKTLSFSAPVTFFAGENGTGKSTLLEAIAVKCGFNPEGGTKNFSFNTCHTHALLYQQLVLTRGYKREQDGFFLRAESFYNVATNIEELDEIPAAAPKIKESYGGISPHRQSHGESFLSLALHRFGGNGLYLLDEPEAALSPQKQLALMRRIHELVNQGSQFIIVTHSPIILAYPNAEIHWFDENGIHLVDYQQTDHYLIMKQFINAPERMLKILLEG